MSELPRFRAADDSDAFRVAVGSRFLVGMGGRLLSVLAATGSRRITRTAERLWAAGLRRIVDLRLETSGMRHVDPEGQYVVVSLHEGFADALALLRLPLDLRFTARDELFDWPVLGNYLRASRQVRIDERPGVAASRRLMRDVHDVFESGESLVVFPQGSILGIEVAFRTGVSRIARSVDRPLLPVVLTGSHTVWEHPFADTVRLGQRVSMEILPPVAAADLDDATMRELERTMKDVALASSLASPRRFAPERDGWWDGYRYEIDPAFDDVARRVALHRDGGT